MQPQSCSNAVIIQRSLLHWRAGGGSAAITIVPIVSHNAAQFAPVGLRNMLNPGGAVLSADYDSTPRRWHAKAQQNSREAGGSRGEGGGNAETAMTVRVEVKGSGEFVAYSSKQPLSVKVMERDVEYAYESAAGQLSISLPRGGPLEQLITVVL